jgi:hypothetical protein
MTQTWTLITIEINFGRVENYHAGVEIDARCIAKNVDVDIAIGHI